MSGPAPLYRPRFPVEFLDQARRLAASRTVAFHLHQRAQLVLLLHDRPTLTNVEAGRRVDLHPNSVRLWRRRWAQGQLTLEDRAGRGRKPSISAPRPGSGPGPDLRSRGQDEEPLA